MENTITPLEFWSQFWKEGTIRFHQKSYNQDMLTFFDGIDLKNKSVLVPLAGKSKDILYFLEKGAIVTAVEFYEPAIVDFFTENHIAFKKEGSTYTAPNLTFIARDFYQFHSQTAFDVLYDRASQVVFNRENRPKYYQHIHSLINKKTILLLFSIDHKGSENYGPPFKISKGEITSAYKKMGIDLKLFKEVQETASEKMQAQGIFELSSFSLSNLPFV
jgi:thiopurine S-methyltransferase